MAPHARTRTVQTATVTALPTLSEYAIPADKAKYIVTKPAMEELLQKTFGAGIAFHVSTKSGRWIYHAERKLTDQEVRKWIAELDKRKKAQEASDKSGAPK